MSTATFRRALLAIVAAGLALRVAYVVFGPGGSVPFGDAVTYHGGANLLAAGRGYIDPLTWNAGVTRPSAYHPPLYTTYLALWSVVGLKSALWHRLASSVLGALTVAGAGLLGRRVGGPQVGLLAAAFAALYPHLWLNDGALLSESAAAPAVVLALLACHRARGAPSWRWAAIAGASLGLVALSRAELVLAVPLIGVPAVWGARAGRVPRIAAVLVTAGAVVAPWVGYNLVRFEEPVTLSTGLGPTMSGGACDATFSGPLLGYWAGCPARQISLPALPAAATRRYQQLNRSGRDADARALLCRYWCPALRARPDESVEDRRAREAALDYIGARTKRFVAVVVPARIGRLWNVFRPTQNARLDADVEGRGVLWSYLALGAYWVLTPLAGYGLVTMRRRREPISPYLVLAGIVTFGAAISFGIQRYRIPVDAVLPVLAATGLSAAAGALRGRRPRAA